MESNRIPFVSRRQQTFLKQLRRLGILNGTPDRVPMKILFALCRFHFDCAEHRALIGLRRDGFLDFDGFDGDCVLVRLPRESEVMETSPRADPLPLEDSLERLVHQYEQNAGHVVIEQDGRRWNGEDEDAEEGADGDQDADNEDPLRRRLAYKPTDQELLADFTVLEDASGRRLTSVLSIMLVKWHWPQDVNPANHRVRLKALGYLVFNKNAGLWSVTESGRTAIRNVEPTLTRAQAQELVHRSALRKHAP